MLTPEQKTQRLDYICGSDAAIICGLSPYKTPLKLWMEKTRRVLEEDISNSNIIKFGNYMEDGVARWFEDESGKELRFHEVDEPKMLIHPEHKWMAGNVDRFLAHENAILECKTTFNFDDWGDGENIIPKHYLLQVAHYCAVGSFDRAYIAVVSALTREMRYYIYDRNLNLEQKLIEKEQNFWTNHILADEPPAPINADDIISMFDKTTSTPVSITIELEQQFQDLIQTKKHIKELENKCEDVKVAIKLLMKDADTLVDRSGKVIATWKFTKPKRKFDDDKLQTEHPDIYEKYLGEEKSQRKLCIKGE